MVVNREPNKTPYASPSATSIPPEVEPESPHSFIPEEPSSENIHELNSLIVSLTIYNNHHESFSPMAKLNTISVLQSLATNLDWPLY